MKRSRGRGRKPTNSLSRTMESNGPDVKVRGTPHQICDKYLALARDANVAGDRIAYEGYLQHAEHYHRIILLSQPANGGGVASPQSDNADLNEDGAGLDDDANDNAPMQSEQPRQNDDQQQRPARARRQRRGRNPRHNNGDAGQSEGVDGNVAEPKVAEHRDDKPEKTAPVETA